MQTRRYPVITSIHGQLSSVSHVVMFYHNNAGNVDMRLLMQLYIIVFVILMVCWFFMPTLLMVCGR